MRKQALIDRSAIGPDTPLRLHVAAGIAYPDGSMTTSGLRREIQRGRLECELTLRDGKVVYDTNGITRPDWTTLPANYTQTGDAAWDAVSPGRGGRGGRGQGKGKQ